MTSREPVNILLVDDQPAKLLSYETILGNLGETLIRTNSGEEALEVLLKTEVAVVLIDVCMPEMDGFELASMIRSHPRFQRTAIILVSGVLVEDIHRLKGYDSGAVDYVSVPIVPEILRAKVAVFADLFRKTKELLRLNDELGGRTAELQQELAMRRIAEERLRQYARELEQSNRELDQFASIASHDLQEPLRMVVSFVGLIAERCQGKWDTETDECVRFAVEGALRMRQLISDLLTYSRVGTRPALQSTDCDAVLRDTIRDLSMPIQQKNGVVTSDSLPTLWAEPSQIGQLFQNLLNNALKFSGPQHPRIHVSARRAGEDWLFSVRDCGIGISPNQHERIFGIFQRLHNREEYCGTGVGLAICKKIVEGHGGRIWVESQPREGATFFFTLPTSRPSVTLPTENREHTVRALDSTL
jgi:signal transduction histidine kinase